jgi:hypothetical protein
VTIESIDWQPLLQWASGLGLTGWVGWQYVVPLVKGGKKTAAPKSDEQPPQAVADWIARTQEQFPTAKPEVVLGWLKGRKTTFEMALDYAGVAKGDVK